MVRKRFLLMLLFLSLGVCAMTVSAREIRIEFTNSGNLQRSEVAEINVDMLREGMLLRFIRHFE